MKKDSNRLLASSLRRMVRTEHRTQVRRILGKSHPADIATVFPSLTPAERLDVFEQIRDPERAAEVLSELEPGVLADFVDRVSDDQLAALLEVMASDDTADILHLLDDERKDRLIARLSLDEQSEAESLISYHPESAGGIMSTEVFALSEETTAGEAIRSLQQDGDDAEVVFYLYVINDHQHLVGVMSLRELVRARKTVPIKELMIHDVIRVLVDQDQEEVARLVARYNLLAVPVVDANNRLVGVVTVDDIIDVIRHEATEDIMKMAGAGEDISPHESPLVGVRARLPWLLPSFAAGIVGALVISHFEASLIELIGLAALIPMLMGMAGNVGTQSSAIVTRWLSVGHLEFVQLGRLMLREIAVGTVIGLIYGALTAAFVAAYFGTPGGVHTIEFALVTGGSVAAAMLLATTLGASSPLVFEKIGLDPALASAPFVNTTIDVLAVWLYLALAATLVTN